MNKQESLELFAQGKDAWNAWAAERQAERAALKAAGTWVESLRERDWNDETRTWRETAKAEFSDHIFEDGIDFSGFEFPGTAGFVRATFRGGARFNRATFRGIAGFDGATFRGGARFDGATFRGGAGFVRATFRGGAGFGGATFRGTARFDGATFRGDAWFDDRATFRGVAWFSRATFRGGAGFGGATFRGTARFRQAVFEGLTTFQRAEFWKAADFLAAQGESAFSFAGAKFLEVPDFEQAHFAEAPRLDNLRIEPGRFTPYLQAGHTASPKYGSDLAARWRALKRLAIRGHDHARELEFFRGELKARRWGEDRPWHAVFWFGVFYETFSDFGRSIFRPLLCWAASVALFACFYLGEQPELDKHRLSGVGWTIARAFSFAGAQSPDLSCVAGPEGEPWRAALGLSLHKGLLFLGGSGSDKLNQIQACLYGTYAYSGTESGDSAGRLLPNIPDGVAILGLVQLVISAALIFLFLLALRNHFRIK